MTDALLELAGFLLVLVGFGLVVGACALVALWLALLAAGVFTVFLGGGFVVVANQRAAVRKP